MKRKSLISGGVMLILALGAWGFLELQQPTFRCPEDYTDEAEYVSDSAKMLAEMLERNPDFNFEEFLTERLRLLEAHGCEGRSREDVADLIDNGHLRQANVDIVTGAGAPVVISPSDEHFEFAGLRYGPYDFTKDDDTKVLSADYEGTDTEWFVLNLYKPGVWADAPLSLTYVADYFKEAIGADVFTSFEVTASAPTDETYYIVALQTTANDRNTDVYLLKFGQIGDTPFSVLYGRTFASLQSSRAAATAWMTDGMVTYLRALARVTPAYDWLLREPAVVR